MNRPNEYGGLSGNRSNESGVEARTLKLRLDALTEQASRNDALFRKTHERELELLRAGSLAELLRLLIHGLRDSYQLDSVALLLHDPNHEIRHLLSNDGFLLDALREVQFADSLLKIVPQLQGIERPWLGPFQYPEHVRLLPKPHHTGSLALIPLRRNEQLEGVLIFSSNDRFRFTRELATDFLSHLGVIAAICLENAVNRARLVHTGLTDFLTGVHNRRYLHSRLFEELARSQRDQRPMACLMIDVDNFKRINDEHGHAAGDAVLREVARRMDGQMRLSDTGARFGGDEFAMLLPHATVTDAEKVAGRVLDSVRGEPIAIGGGKFEHITLSIGVAAAEPPAQGLRDYKTPAEVLLAQADAALYKAKNAGRNRVSGAA